MAASVHAYTLLLDTQNNTGIKQIITSVSHISHISHISQIP